MHMTKEDRDEWLTALRSGEFQQGVHNLNYRDEKFCCLGVLCELQHRKGFIKKFGPPEVWHAVYGELHDRSSSVLPGALCRKFMVDFTGPDITHRMLKDTSKLGYLTSMQSAVSGVAHLNDQGYTFSEIADLLEQVIEIVPNYEGQTA